MENDIFCIDKEYVKKLLPFRPDDAHKGTMGTLVSVTGSRGMAGAAIMSAKGALRSGVGLLKQVCVKSIYPIMASAVYESVYLVFDETAEGTLPFYYTDEILEEVQHSDALLVGCGCRNTENMSKMIKLMVRKCRKPLVIDADGLNALSEFTSVLDEAQCEVVLTPHVLEMARLMGCDKEYIIQNREKAAKEFSEKYTKTVLVLKGHDTIVARKGSLFINPTGNSGMAKGGSGDVLAGIIGSLCAQGLSPLNASVAGVYVHGLAGDILSLEKGRTSMLPSEIPDYLCKAFTEIEI